MTPGKKFFVIALIVTIPMIGGWSYFARDILTGVAAWLGHTLHPLVFFVVAMSVNFAIVHITLGKTIARIKSEQTVEAK